MSIWSDAIKTLGGIGNSLITNIPSLVTGAAANYLGSIIDERAQKNANLQNIALAKYQNEWNEMMWQKQVEYNDPSAQMERLKNAGLNPNLVYGSGNAIHSAPSAQPAATVRVNPYLGRAQAMAQAVAAFNSVRLSNEQVKNLRSQNANIQADTELKKAQKENTENQSKYSELMQAYQAEVNEVYSATKDALKRMPYIQNELTEAKINETTQHTTLMFAQTEVSNAQIKLLNLEVLRTQAMIKQVEAQYGLTLAQIKTEVTRQLLNRASAANQYASAANNYASASEHNARTNQINYQTEHILPATEQLIFGQTASYRAGTMRTYQQIHQSERLFGTQFQLEQARLQMQQNQNAAFWYDKTFDYIQNAQHIINTQWDIQNKVERFRGGVTDDIMNGVNY